MFYKQLTFYFLYFRLLILGFVWFSLPNSGLIQGKKREVSALKKKKKFVQSKKAFHDRFSRRGTTAKGDHKCSCGLLTVSLFPLTSGWASGLQRWGSGTESPGIHCASISEWVWKRKMSRERQLGKSVWKQEVAPVITLHATGVGRWTTPPLQEYMTFKWAWTGSATFQHLRAYVMLQRYSVCQLKSAIFSGFEHVILKLYYITMTSARLLT